METGEVKEFSQDKISSTGRNEDSRKEKMTHGNMKMKKIGDLK
jgi:hypothetical protein